MAKHQVAPKKVNKLSSVAMANRLKKMVDLKKEYIKRIKSEGYESVLSEMKLMKGNDKTGKYCWTVSTIPVHDCTNCKECSGTCYDLRNDCIYPGVVNDRARNSALKECDPVRFWGRVSELIKEMKVKELRINVGGDLKAVDFPLVTRLGDQNKECSILFFTKNYKDVDEYLDVHSFPENVSAIRSRWINMDDNGNRHCMPCSHVLWESGDTTAPEYGAVYCGGNCSECHMKGDGCWNLKNSEHVIFMAH